MAADTSEGRVGQLGSPGAGRPAEVVLGLLAGAFVISRERELERRLRVSADFMRTVTQAMADGLYVLDESGRLSFMNVDQAQGWALGRPAPIEDVYATFVERSGS